MGRSEEHLRSIVEGVVQDEVLPLFQSSAESPSDLSDLTEQMESCCSVMQNKLDTLMRKMNDLTSDKPEDSEDKKKEREILKKFLEQYLKEDFSTTTNNTLKEIIDKTVEVGGNAVLDVAGLATDLIKAIFYATQFWEVKHRLSEIERDLKKLKDNNQECCQQMKQMLQHLADDDEDILNSLSNMHRNMEECCTNMSQGLDTIKSTLSEIRGLL